ncbi:MAG: nickel pincer cofactor biosynthesis protein LarC, partial [Deltaproteobacteria bacterium]|nr:nickel pincer cofactor biosynthesis protein LarC [Deltaproteobacteria bacterium]
MDKRILYFDCSSGISGDMCVSALIDLGADFNGIKAGLKKLPLEGYTLGISKEKRHGITGTRFKVKTLEHGHGRGFSDIKKLIEKSALAQGIKKLSIKIFENLAIAEAKVHGTAKEDVHFHEVGAIDSIMDIVGSAIALDMLCVDRIYSSALPLGSGFVNSSHGIMPAPAPATVELLKDVSVTNSMVQAEVTTPTGAAILKTIASSFGGLPAMTIKGAGYGIGTMDFKEIPNVLRVIMGEATAQSEQVLMLETNIDDSNPQV